MPAEGIKVLKNFANEELGRRSKRLKSVIGLLSVGHGIRGSKLRVPVVTTLNLEKNPILKEELNEFLGEVRRKLKEVAEEKSLPYSYRCEGKAHCFRLYKKK